MRLPSFVWTARLRINPFVRLDVRDLFLDGKGNTLVTVGGALPVIDTQPSDEIDQSAQLRWLMEAVWSPLSLARKSL